MKSLNETKIPTENQSQYDVVISGAGPVGLFLACELALANCSVLILEKSLDPHSLLKKLPFGIRGLSTPSIEALDRRGLLKELELHKRMKNPHSHAGQGANRQVGHFAGIPFLEGNVDASQWKYRLPGSTDTGLITEMEEIEKVLTRRAESLGVIIHRGHVVADFSQNDDEVNIEAIQLSPEGLIVQSDKQYFKAKWLVGCDGSRSVIRKKGGFEFAGTEPEFTGYSVRADIVNPELLRPGRNLTEKGMYLQSQPGYFAIQDFDKGVFHDSGNTITREHIQDVLRSISDTEITISTLHYATTWTDRARQATTYRNRRVFLAGDAAHIHSPLGGQGLNLGLGDAMNLGWKLAAAIHGTAPEDLLDTYFTERYPIGVKVLDWSRAQVAIMEPKPAARALHNIVRDLMNTRDGATYFAGRVWGVHTNYNLGSGHSLTGHSVPNFEFHDGSTLGEILRDGRGVLLDLNTNSSLKNLAEKYRGQIKYFSAHAKEQFGLTALLIRPDGIVTWATEEDPDMGEVRNDIERWFLKCTY